MTREYRYFDTISIFCQATFTNYRHIAKKGRPLWLNSYKTWSLLLVNSQNMKSFPGQILKWQHWKMKVVHWLVKSIMCVTCKIKNIPALMHKMQLLIIKCIRGRYNCRVHIRDSVLLTHMFHNVLWCQWLNL